MTRTVTRLFDSPEEALAAARELERSGVAAEDISLLANNQESWADDPVQEDARRGVDRGMAAGAVVGGGLGALAGLGVLAIPGVGPAVAAGWLLSSAIGVLGGAAAAGAAGGLAAGLMGDGISEEESQVLIESLRRGGAVLSVRAPADQAGKIASVLERHGAAATALRGQAYREAGWIGFDPQAHPYDREEILQEREQRRAARTADPRAPEADEALMTVTREDRRFTSSSFSPANPGHDR